MVMNMFTSHYSTRLTCDCQLDDLGPALVLKGFSLSLFLSSFSFFFSLMQTSGQNVGDMCTTSPRTHRSSAYRWSFPPLPCSKEWLGYQSPANVSVIIGEMRRHLSGRIGRVRYR